MGTDVSAAPNRNFAFAEALLSELADAGVREACIAPGSRSAPLAIAAHRSAALHCIPHLDERSAAFFALGLAKAGRRPVALICTSGTAAANFHPAVIEAHYARVPLVVLTADRPQELRDWGAGQSIDQQGLYGRHVRWFAEAPIPETSLLRHARALACRAVAEAAGPPAGPVHLDLPFREPLDPRRVPEDAPRGADLLGRRGRPRRPYTIVRRPARVAPPELVRDLAARIGGCQRGIVVCGPMDAEPGFTEAAIRVARAAGWPLIADGASSLRGGPQAIEAPLVVTADLLLRDADFARTHAPEFVLQLGDAPTSKAFRQWLEAHPPHELVRVDPDAIWHDASHLASEVIQADPEALCRDLAAALGEPGGPSPWLAEILAAESRSRAALAHCLADESTLLEPRAVQELAAGLPDGALLYVSSSMPIRDLDAFLPVSPRRQRVLCNRGANGIDGMVSSALGAAGANSGPVVLLLGDVAFAHDVSGFLASRRLSLSLCIVVLDNGGGGIFSFLPVAEHGHAVGFDEHFLTPPELDLEALCRAARARYARVESWEHFRAALKDSFSGAGVSVLHVPVDRERNVAHFRSVVSRVGAAWRGAAS